MLTVKVVPQNMIALSTQDTYADKEGTVYSRRRGRDSSWEDEEEDF